MFSGEEHLPLLSELTRGEGPNTDKAPTTLSKESEQRLRSTERGKHVKTQALRASKPVEFHRHDRIPTSSR